MTQRPRSLGLGFVVLLVLGTAALMMFISRHKPVVKAEFGEAPPVVTVSTWRVVERTLSRSVLVTGSISAVDALPVGASATGLRIEQVNVEEGDVVERGQVLAVLDASVLRAQREQLEARLQSSLAAVPKAQQPNRPQEIAVLQNALSQARANAHQAEATRVQARASYENAQRNHARYEKLLADGYVTRKEFDDRDTELRTTRALDLAAQDAVRAANFTVQQASSRLALAQAGGRGEDISIARANSDEVRALLRQLDAQIDLTVVRAPDAGRIIKRDAHIGDISSPAKTLFVIVRRNELELRAQVPEIDLAHIRVGQRVQLLPAAEAPETGPSGGASGAPREAGASAVTGTESGAPAASPTVSGSASPSASPSAVERDAAGAPSAASTAESSTAPPVYGTVWLINPVIDPQSRLGTVRIRIPTDLGLLSGMFVRARIDAGTEAALMVPARAVLGPADDRFVFVLDGVKVHRRSVRTGAAQGELVRITSGLSEGQMVVVDGGGFLTEGDTVRVSSTPSSAPSSAGSSAPVTATPSPASAESGKSAERSVTSPLSPSPAPASPAEP